MYSTYLMVTMNYLRCSYDVQAKTSSHVQEKWFNDWYAATSTTIISICMIFGNYEVLLSSSLIDPELVV